MSPVELVRGYGAMKRVFALAGIVTALFPGPALADYLYSMMPALRQPRVIVLVDNTSAFSSTELETVKYELGTLMPRLDGMAVWLGRYGKLSSSPSDECKNDVAASLVDATRTQLLTEIIGMASGGKSPLGTAIGAAETGLKAIAKADTASDCRPYFVVLLTGGRGDNCTSDDTDRKVQSAITGLRDVDGNGVKDLDIRTFVIRYGTDSYDDAERDFWNDIARRGGTALTTSGFCGHTPHQPCAAGSSMFASTATELRGHLNRVFAELLHGEYSAIAPVIGTAPFVDTEVERVARNFMAYSSFRMPGSEGHLYGIRLFMEESAMSGRWRFTNFDDLDLNTCGDSAANPCAFDAGKKLLSKVGQRKIITATPRTPVVTRESGQLAAITIPLEPTPALLGSNTAGIWNFQDAWLDYASIVNSPLQLSSGLPANTTNLGEASDAAQLKRTTIVRWLQGETRSWPLGDLYHSGATVIGPSGYAYRTRGYPTFAQRVKNRPTMIYIGANDGMIHAFHATPKLTYQAEAGITASWTAGEEAWAYLPLNMLARASSAILDGENRFFSQDLSCRVDDVLVTDNMSSGTLDCDDDPLCGWRTILVCGQGWGGSWYVGIDISDPLDPHPLWESTYAGTKGLGRTWNVPGLALLNDAGMPTWAAVVGNGYNADMACSGITCPTPEKYRLLNLPFLGLFPQHGNGVGAERTGRMFLIDIATGHFLTAQDSATDGTSGPIVADTPVIDSDFDGWTDAAFAGNWQSQIDQLVFGTHTTTRRVTYSMCKTVAKFSGADNKAITSRPSALASTSVTNRVHLFVGAGVDGGTYPDEQGDSGNRYDFAIWDLDGKTCASRTSDLCTNHSGSTIGNIFADGSRLVGSPLFVLRRDGERWLTFTTWRPASVSQPCATSVAMLRCLETSRGSTCSACGDLNGDGTPDASTDLDTGGRQPTSPTSADGQLYVTTPEGPVRVSNQTGLTGGVAGGSPSPNQGAPTSAMILGWREVFD